MGRFMYKTITQRIDEISVVIEAMRTLTKLKSGWYCSFGADEDHDMVWFDITNPEDDGYSYWFRFSFSEEKPHLYAVKYTPHPDYPEDDIQHEEIYEDYFDPFSIHSRVMQLIGEAPFVEID